VLLVFQRIGGIDWRPVGETVSDDSRSHKNPQSSLQRWAEAAVNNWEVNQANIQETAPFPFLPFRSFFLSSVLFISSKISCFLYHPKEYKPLICSVKVGFSKF
jgi:hypothetical protein